ncbi:MAG TPA: sigma-70 family RNA polymerase sigma factor [Thermomicrobiales bacterium]|nr:sigma-70 family RNA polymerase sigma factor [Thermomicrobiales bacterium]
MTQPPNDEGHSDGDLLARIAARDDAALGDLYDRYSGLAFGLAYRVLRDRGQAEDVVQEAFLAVWRRAATFDAARGSARGWLTSIVHNAAIDRRRGRFRHQQDEVDIEDHAWRLADDDVWEDVSRRLDREQVRRALAQIPNEQRETLELAYFGGLTQAEIAAQTGEPLGTVKSRARLGLRRLEGLLRGSGTGDESGSGG